MLAAGKLPLLITARPSASVTTSLRSQLVNSLRSLHFGLWPRLLRRCARSRQTQFTQYTSAFGLGYCLAPLATGKLAPLVTPRPLASVTASLRSQQTNSVSLVNLGLRPRLLLRYARSR